MKSGKDLTEVLQLFASEIDTAQLLVAHNFNFDRNIVGAEFYRKLIKNLLQNKPSICTMNSSTNFCALPGGYRGFKWPKLSELHYKLFKENFTEQHNAMHDISATARCFWELKKRGVIKLNIQ
jgi:DNA polymerase III subunit epsilon